MRADLPAAVIGSGPNGLAAAVTLARAGIPVTVFEAAEQIGGGAQTREVVLPGVRHDLGSAIHPLALATGFFRVFGIEERMRFTVPEVSYAHPMDRGGVTLAFRDLERTVRELGAAGDRYRRLVAPLVCRGDELVDLVLGENALHLPRSAAQAMLAAGYLRRALGQGIGMQRTPDLLAGVFAHSVAPIPGVASAAAGLLLATLAHTVGWPVPIGGSGAITEALAAELRAHGGRIITGERITAAAQLRRHGDFGVRIHNTSAAMLVQVERETLPSRYASALRRFRGGNGVCVLHLILDGPIPWQDPRVASAPTVHLGGSFAEIALSEREVSQGKHAARPFVLLTQPAAHDPQRNPAGVHAVTAYAHVPRGSKLDESEAMLAQIERFAPGTRERIVAMRAVTAAELGAQNPNFAGGDIANGAITLGQLIARPKLSASPWKTPARGVYLASAASAPGPGVHGLAGWYAARAALREVYGVVDPPRK